MRYIALLGGVNVGGHQVKMERLRALFTELGYANVRTYIQTGNVFFDTQGPEETDEAALTAAIEARLREALGFAVPTFLRTLPEVERTLAVAPFTGMEVTPDMRLTVVFTARPIPQTLALPAQSPKGDMEIRQTTAREAFVIWRLIDGRPPSSGSFLEKTLGSKSTSRFFHTTAKIVAAARGE